MKEEHKKSILYGPVQSWRFGKSLGIDPILTHSACSFNCVYCQLGFIQEITSQRKVFVKNEKIKQDFDAFTNKETIDVVTISGNGEPTLALNLDYIIACVKASFPKVAIHILTNATLLHQPVLRKTLRELDEICCKLDVCNDQDLKALNRADKTVTLEQIIAGIIQMRQECKNKLSLQITLLPHKLPSITKLITIVNKINPHVVYLNRPKRVYPTSWQLEFRGDHVTTSEKAQHKGKSLNLLSDVALQEWGEPFFTAIKAEIVVN